MDFDVNDKRFPEWMTSLESKETFMKKNEQYPANVYRRLAKGAASYYPEFPYIEEVFYSLFWDGLLSPATPVAKNAFGGSEFGISCFALHPANSIDSIYSKVHEQALLSKNGGGVSVYLGEIDGPTPANIFGLEYDQCASTVSQGTRRGATALFSPAKHKDINMFLNAKDLLEGDPKLNFDCNIAVIFDHDDMKEVKKFEGKMYEIFLKCLQLRMNWGSPYIIFIGNAQDEDPVGYVNNGLKTLTSNICTEIFQYTDPLHSFICALSSWCLHRWDKIENNWMHGRHVLEYGVWFLDAVIQDFIDTAHTKRYLHTISPAVRSAEKGRSIGLGVIGYHEALIQRGITWKNSSEFNIDVFSDIDLYATAASRELASLYGEPEWMKGTGLRNAHVTAVAPTQTNSVIANSISQGIYPIDGNAYLFTGSEGNYIRKNPYLKELLQEIGKDTDDIWFSILENGGSVQHLDCLTPKNKELYLTFTELDPLDLIKAAAIRQPFISQGQSLNLYYDSECSMEKLIGDHILAYEFGLKSLYYLRSNSDAKKVIAEKTKKIDYVYIETREDCIYCHKAKKLLTRFSIDYIETTKETGRVPRIELVFDDNSRLLMDDGYTSLAEYLGVNDQQSECSNCEG